MPNHVKNVIKASSEVIESIVNESGSVDFGLVIAKFEDGMGNGINCAAESFAECLAKFEYDNDCIMSRMKLSNMIGRDIRELDGKGFDDFLQMVKNYREHGYFHGMDFARKQWGTKWNAYDCDVKDNEVTFNTAWSHPDPVIRALSIKFPDDEIKVEYADEDIGSNLGSYTIKNGEKIFNNEIKNKDEFAIKLHYGEDAKPEDFDRDGNWKYIED